MAGTLYIVATPIGNLDDMPPRVAATFGAADFIAAEDTRVTMKLLNFLGLKKPMVSYYEHALQKGEGILRRIEAGENCALCSDAGMPCVSDPGEVIARCVAYKAGVVERDEKEQGERKLLNLGHTVGHAIEKCSGYVIPHGHAVAAGLAVIARAAEALGWTEESLAARITACLSKNGLPTGTDYSAEALAEAALSDKKRAGGDITLVVPRKIGHCELRKVPVADLLPIIRAGLEA